MARFDVSRQRSRADAVCARTTFQPQRLYPRFATAFYFGANVPGGLRPLCRVLGRWAFTQEPSDTENPRPNDLKTAAIAVCSFPRTGSTFLKLSIEESLDASGSCWRSHDVLSIPVYEQAGLLTIISLRKPADTVVSWSAYNEDEPTVPLMRSRIRAYTAWHREALRFTGRQDVRVLQFNYFTKTPGLALQTKFDAAGIRPVRPVSSECVAERLRNENQRAQVGSSRSNLPDSSRAQKCARYERVLAEPALVRDLAAANKVFEALVAKAPVPVTRRGSFGASVAGFGVAGGAIASAANTSSRLY